MNDELIAALVASIKIQGLKQVTKDINAFAGQMRSMANTANTSLNSAGKSVNTFATRIKTSFQQNSAQIRMTGRYLTVFGAALTGLVAKGGANFIKFQKEAANTSTMLSGTIGEVVGQMAVYNEGIKRLSISYNQTTSTLQKGLYDILSASIDASEAMYVLEVSSEAATAGLTTVAHSADAITTILNSYQMSAMEAGDVSDRLWAIVRKGKITFDQVASGIGKVAATAAVAGLSFEELGAGIATATRAGVRSREAMTGMNSILLAYLKHTDDQVAAAKKFGIELSSTSLKAEGMAGMVRKLAGANDMNRKATAEEIVAIFANRRALKALLPILQNTAGFLSDVAFMHNSAGFSALAYSKIAASLSHQLGQLGKQLNILMMDYFEPLAPMVGKVVTALRGMAAMFNSLPPGIKAAISTITLLTGVFLTLSGVLLMLAPGIAAVATALSGPMFLGIGIVIASLIGGGGLIAALNRLGIDIDKAGENMLIFNQRLQDMAKKNKDAEESMRNLIDGYKKYKGIIESTEEGTTAHTVAQRNLSVVLKKLIALIPDAANQWDEYGNVIDVDIKKVEAFTKTQRRMYELSLSLAALEAEQLAKSFKKKKEQRDSEIFDIQTRLAITRSSLDKELQLYRDFQNDFYDIKLYPAELKEIYLKESAKNIKILKDKLDALLVTYNKLRIGQLESESAVYAFASALMKLTQEGKITDTELENHFATVEGLRTAYNEMAEEGVTPLTESFIKLGDTMVEIRKKYPDFKSYVQGVKDAASKTTDWRDEVADLDEEIEGVIENLEDLYSAQDRDTSYEERMDAERELIDLINKRTKVSEAGLETESTAVDKLVKTYSKAMHDFQEFQDASTQTVLNEIEKRQEAYKEDSDEWLAWEQVKVEYTRAAAAEITAIWGALTDDLAGDMVDTINSVFMGLKDDQTFKDLLDDLGTSFAENFSDAVSEYLGKTLSFEDYFASTAGLIATVAFTLAEMGEEKLREIIDGMISMIEELPQILADLMAELPKIIALLAKKIPEILDSLVEALPGIIDALVQGLPAVIDALVAAIPGIVNAIISAIPQIVQVLLDALPLIITVISDGMAKIVTMLGTLIPEIITSIVEILPEILNSIVEAIPLIIDALIQGFTTMIDALVEAIPLIIQAVLEAIPLIIKAVLEAIPLIIRALLEAIPLIITALFEGLDKIIKMIGKMLPEIIKTIIEMIPVIIQAIIEMIPEIIWAIIELLPVIVQAVIEGVILILTTLIGGIFGAMATAILAIFHEVALMFQQIGQAIATAFNSVMQFFRQVIQKILNIFKSLGQAILKVFESVVEIITNIFSDVGDFMAEVWDELMGTVEDIFSGMGDLWDELIDFIEDIFSDMGDIGGGVFDDIGGGLADLGGWAKGTRWTGSGPIDEVAGVVHRQEAVIPWSALKDGLAGIAQFMGYDLPQAARGMIVNGLTPLIAGENGPEAIIPFDKLSYMISSLLSAPSSFDRALPGLLSAQEAVTPSSLTMGQGWEPNGGGGNISGDTNWYINVTMPPGSTDDPEYWRRMARDKMIPAIEDELSRQGKKLGG